MRYRIFIATLLCMLFLANNYDIAHANEFGPFRGKIVDVNTKEPIEGVVVLVEWWKVPLFGGSIFIDAQETVTDREGNFYLPGIWVFNPIRHFGTDTMMTIFKSGYQAISGGVFRDWKEANTKWIGVLKIEGHKPVFGLKKLTMEGRKKQVDSFSVAGVAPKEKVLLMLREIDKDLSELGLEPYKEKSWR